VQLTITASRLAGGLPTKFPSSAKTKNGELLEGTLPNKAIKFGA